MIRKFNSIICVFLHPIVKIVHSVCYMYPTITTLFFFLGKLANVLLKNFVTTLGAFFDALIQCTDGCTEVLWLLVQTHHIIRCSHKRYKNRHFSQRMIFRYCEEGSGEPVQTCRLPRAFAASTRDLYIYYVVQ